VNKVYDDAFANEAKEGGKALTDTTKALRLFMTPIKMLAMLACPHFLYQGL
jgi:hypothetical protein